VRDVVRPGVDALVVPPGDDRALAAAIRRAFEAAGETSTMGAAARQRVLERYAADRVVAAYRELLAGVRR
jgi:glycosyltransferase involved in cell wall biosynthesis